MRKTIAGLVLAAALLAGTGPAHAYREGGECNREGNCNDQRRCSDAGDNCRGSFSPGPFDRSPVEISGNTICMPGATCYAEPPKKGQQPS